MPTDAIASFSLIIGGSRVLFGRDSVDQVGRLTLEMGGSRILIITDPGVRAAGHVERAARSLQEVSLRCFVFDGVEENPTTRHVEAGTELARQRQIDFLVGLGGGSAMDCAKGINFLLTNGGRMEDYWGIDKATQPMLPAIGIPTTAGTGSEAQRFALIAQRGSHQKMPCGDDKARFGGVILDPELTSTVPSAVAKATALDAVAHAVETYVTRPRNPVSQMYSRQAWRLLMESLDLGRNAIGEVDARARRLLGAHLAGAAIECSMLGAAHACANPLTAIHDISHGAAVGLMLPHVVRFNEPAVGFLYDELLQSCSDDPPDGTLSEYLDRLGSATGLPMRLRDYGLSRTDLVGLAKSAANEWTAEFNPRPVATDELRTIYDAAF